jgi:hypothetical protein
MDHEYGLSNIFRPLFSSLLEALPKRTWDERDDVYECREAEYIAEVEESLLYAKGQMIVHLFHYFLYTRTNLSPEKADKVCGYYDREFLCVYCVCTD